MAITARPLAIPRTVTSGGSVRFYPHVTGNTLPIVSYSWTFGDGGTSTDATPIHQYPTVTVKTTYNVALTVTDAGGNVGTYTFNYFIVVDTAAHVEAYPTDETYNKISILIYDDEDSMMLSRTQITGSVSTATDLLHFNGTNGSTTITDNGSSPKTWTCHGTAQLTTTSPKFGSACLSTGNSYVDTPASSDFVIGDGTDASICFWINPQSSGGANHNIVGQFDHGAFTGFPPFAFYWDGNGAGCGVYVSIRDTFGDNIVIGGTTTFSNGTWYFVHIRKLGDGTWGLYINGTEIDSVGHLGTGLSDSRTFSIGNGDGSFFDDFIFIKGTALDGSFVPASEYTGYTALDKMYISKPVVIDSLDKVGTATFSVLDAGNSSSTERGLLVAKKNVIVIMGTNIIFNGAIRRVTLDSQISPDTTQRVKLWNVECDSWYGALKYQNVDSSALDASGKAIIDTPGNIARRVLAPTGSEFDMRNVINEVDAPISYQINTVNNIEQPGSRYDHLENIRQLTNYDLRTYTDSRLMQYSSYSAGVFTLTTGALATNEFVGMFVIFVGKYKADGSTVNTKGVLAYGRITANTTTTITATMYGDSNVNPSNDMILITGAPSVDFAQDLTQPSSLASWTLNKQLFGFQDNDDPRKLATKVICRGKDLFGKSISVAVSAVHAHDNTKQLPNDTTYVTKKVEGYVASNTNTPKVSGVLTVHPAMATPQTWTPGYPSQPTDLDVVDGTKFWLGQHVWVYNSGGSLPSPFSPLPTFYYVAAVVLNIIDLSTSPTLTPVVSMLDGGSGTQYVNDSYGGIIVDNTTAGFASGDAVQFGGTSLPGGISAGVTYYILDATRTVSNWSIRVSTSPGGTPVTITSAGSGVKMFSAPTGGGSAFLVYLYGWGFTMPVGTVINLVVPFGSVYTTTVTAVNEVVDNNGQLLTELTVSDPIQGDFSGRGFCLANRIYVDDATRVGTNEVLIGEEKITITGTGTDSTYGNYITVNGAARISSASLKCYPHGVGALVARTNYTEASPEALSPVAVSGIVIDDRTADSNIAFGDLDTYATQFLLGTSTFYRKATTYGPIPAIYIKRVGMAYHGVYLLSKSTPPRPGDRISTVEYTGATPVEWQVVSVTIKPDEGLIYLELGDFERNVFSSMEKDTTSINWTIT